MIAIEYATWMRPVKPANSEQTFLLLGRVTNMSQTDALILDQVSIDHRYLYCKLHQYVYPPSEHCLHCCVEERL